MFRIVFAVLFLFFSSSFCNEIFGRVVKIADGDTITILTNDNNQIRVRLFGIDAPETKQAFSKKSKEFLSGLIAGKDVLVKFSKKDRYGRILGIVYHNKTDINEQMVLNGYAWAYLYYSKEYEKQMKRAKQQKLGLWQDKNPTEPYIFRKKLKK